MATHLDSLDYAILEESASGEGNLEGFDGRRGEEAPGKELQEDDYNGVEYAWFPIALQGAEEQQCNSEAAKANDGYNSNTMQNQSVGFQNTQNLKTLAS